MKGDDVTKMNIVERIENVIKLTNDLIVENPENTVFKFMLRGLEALKSELSKPSLNKDRIGSLHYGFIRSYEAVAAKLDDTPFGEEVEKLLLELNEYST